jgi:hypothetical protein
MWPGVLSGVVLAYAFASLAGGRTFVHRDTERLYAPVRGLVVEALRQGELPLWNRYEFAGKPLFAEGIHSVLHPVSLLGALLAPESVDFLIVAYLVAAALGAFALGRSLGVSEAAATAMGGAYALSGFTLSMTGNLVYLAGAATMPWLLGGARAAAAGGRGGVAWGALATACAFLAGDVQAAAVGVALGLSLAADAGGWRGLGRAAASVAAGGALAGVQVVATGIMVGNTDRLARLSPENALRWPLIPARLLEWVTPGLFDVRVDGTTRSSPVFQSLAKSPDRALSFAESVYVGSALLFFAAIGGARRRTGRVLAGAAIALLWLAFGHHAGADAIVREVPIWSGFRYPEKLMGAIGLCLSALAAIGIDSASRDGISPRARVAAGVLGGAAIAGAATCWLAPAPAASLLSAAGFGSGSSFAVRALAVGLPHAAVGVLGAWTCARLLSSRPEWVGRGAALVLVLQSIAAAPYARAAVRLASEPAPPTAAAALGDAAGGARLIHSYFHEVERCAGLEGFEADECLRRRMLFGSYNVAHRAEAIEGYTGFDSMRYSVLRRPGRFLGHLDRSRRFAGSHVVLQPPWDNLTRNIADRATAGGRMVLEASEPAFQVWEVPHRPAVFFASGAVHSPGIAEGIRMLDVLERLGDDRVVLIEGGGADLRTGSGRVHDVRTSNEELLVDAESEGPGLLVLNYAYWPGWEAAIDGASAEILPADVLVRAVRWPPGRHRLRMRYAPREIAVGWSVSALGALGLAALLLATRRGGATLG